MKKLITSALIIIFLFLNGCDRASSSINASSDKTLYRSVKGIKEFLPGDKKLSFEIGFWSLKRWSENDEQFKELIHRKTADEVIALAKEKFEEKKSSGDPRLADYPSWDEMIKKFLLDRQGFAIEPTSDN